MKTTKIDLEDFDALTKLIEKENELAYHLYQYKEAVKKRLEELELIKQKAQAVMSLKGKFRAVQPELWRRLSPEDVKTLNAMLIKYYIRI